MSYTYLSYRERYVISHLQGRISLREIGRRIGRHHTTISRELKRNGNPHSVYWYYWILTLFSCFHEEGQLSIMSPKLLVRHPVQCYRSTASGL